MFLKGWARDVASDAVMPHNDWSTCHNWRVLFSAVVFAVPRDTSDYLSLLH